MEVNQSVMAIRMSCGWLYGVSVYGQVPVGVHEDYREERARGLTVGFPLFHHRFVHYT